MSDLLIPSFLVSDVSKLLRSLTKNEQCERIAQVTHQKWATMSKSLRSLTKNERIARFWSESLSRSFLGKNRAIRSETEERIPSPDTESVNIRHNFKVHFTNQGQPSFLLKRYDYLQ